MLKNYLQQKNNYYKNIVKPLNVDLIKTLNEEQELTNDIKLRMEKFNINLKHNEKITNKQIDDSDLESNKSEKSEKFDDNKKLKIIVKNKKDIKMPLKKLNKK
jgi:hypothetical protein